MAIAGKGVPFSTVQVQEAKEKLDGMDEKLIEQRLMAAKWEKRQRARKRGGINR